MWPAYQPEPRWKELGLFPDGKGEWQNVYEAKPKWKGHIQPLKPLWGYENEADPKVVEKKIETALSYIMWANHNVCKLWDNKAADKKWKEPIWLAGVDADEFRKISKRWIQMYFSRSNYYCIGGKPVLMIYEIGTFVKGIGGIEKASETIATLREDSVKAGLGGIHLMACDYSLTPEMVRCLGADSATIYNFVHWASPKGNPDYAAWSEKGAQRFDVAKKSLSLPMYFAHASVGWDTNPRYPMGAVETTVMNSTPEKFKVALKRAKDWADKNNSSGEPKLITVNSWNEWTEGSYLEPDMVNKYGYLEAIQSVFAVPEASH